MNNSENSSYFLSKAEEKTGILLFLKESSGIP